MICDQTVALSGFYSNKHYPHHLRRVHFKHPEKGKISILPLLGPPARFLTGHAIIGLALPP